MFIINFIAIIYFLNDIYFFASFFVEFDKWEIIQDVESGFHCVDKKFSLSLDL
jgi:hypothetical protein